MTSIPTRGRVGSGLLGIITVLATLFSGLVALPATAAIPGDSQPSIGRGSQLPDPGYPQTIHGVVLDVDDNPMEGVTVYAYNANSDNVPAAQDVTDADGAYSLPMAFVGDYKLALMGSDYADLGFYNNVVDFADAEVITVTDSMGAYVTVTIGDPAPPTGTASVEGTVVDDNGDAVEGANVDVITLDGDTVSSNTTDNLGRYVITSLPEGTFTVCFTKAGYIDSCLGGASDYQFADTFDLVEDQYRVLDESTIVEAGAISGTVWPEDVSGAGLEGILVSAFAFNGWSWSSVASAETDSDGFYEITGLEPGTYYVVADPEFSETGLQPEWHPNGTRREQSSSVSVSGGVTSTNINFELSEGGSISVTAYCGDTDTLCANAFVYVDALDGTLPESFRGFGGVSQTTVFDGLPDGRYQVRMATTSDNEVYVGGDGTSETAEIITITGGQDVTGIFHLFEAEQLPATISGTVAGLDGASIQVTLLGEPRYDWEESVTVDETWTDTDGFYSFTVVPGRYTIQFGESETYDDNGNMRVEPDFWGGAYRLSRATWFDVSPDAVIDGDFTPPTRNASITGTVKNNATPAVGQSGVVVTLTSINGTVTAVTTAGGNYSATGLAPGLYTLSMERDGLTSTWNPAVASRPTVNATSSSGSYVLNGTMAVAGARVNGRVTGSGAAVTDSPVYVSARRKANDCPISITEADESGNYSLTSLPAGTFTITASTAEPVPCLMGGGFTPTADTNWIATSRDVTVTATQTLSTQNIALGVGAKIRGLVRDHAGNVFAGETQVGVVGLNDDFIAFGSVEADGTYEVKGLTAGSYYVQVWESPTSGPAWFTGGTGRRVPVTVSAAQTMSDINLTASAGSTINGVIAPQSGGSVSGDIQAYDVLGLPVGYGSITDPSTGAYAVTSLPDGPIRIKFVASGREFWVGGGTSLATAGITYVGGGATTTARQLDIPSLGSISGDATVAGLGESGTVALIDSSGRILATDETSNGSYYFANVAPGLYTVRFVSENREIVWYGNRDSFATATYFSVTAGGIIENINLNAIAATSAFVPGVVTTTGTLNVGQVLTAAAGTWTPAPTAIQYRWTNQWDGVPLSTAATYTLTAADVGKFIRLDIIITKAGVASESMTINLGLVKSLALTTTPTPTIAPATAPKVGTLLTATTGTWAPTGVGFTYQWLRGGTPILGATASTYTTTADDLGARISVMVVGTRAGYSGVVKTSAQLLATVPAALTATPVPTVAVTGLKQPGGILSATAGSWTPAPVGLAFQWKRGSVSIPGATSPTYTLTSEDIGASITVVVTGSKVGFTSVPKTSAAVTGITSGGGITGATPTISGDKFVGELLIATPGTWSGGSTLSYQWLRNGKQIPGATNISYRLVSTDLSASIRVRVTGTLSGSTLVKYSSATSVVQPGTLTGPSQADWNGNFTVGGTISVEPVEWSAPVKNTFQWMRDGVPIRGATKSSYTLTNRDVGYLITVEVTTQAKGYATVVMESSGLTLQ